MKLVAAERESVDLARYLSNVATWVASSLVIVEVGRALARRPGADHSQLFRALETLVLLDPDRRILERAAGLGPAQLRSLDAIHIATAIEVRDSIDALVTYDERLGAAARTHGFLTVAPGATA